LPNAKNSATLAVVIDGKRKRWHDDHTKFVLLNSQLVPSLNVKTLIDTWHSCT